METKAVDLSEGNLASAIETFLRQAKVLQESEDLITLDFDKLMRWDTNETKPVHCTYTIKKVS